MDPTDAAHVKQTPEEYADFLATMPFDRCEDTLNDIEEILPRRGESVGLDRVIPILTLFQALESRAPVSFEAHRRTLGGAEAIDAREARAREWAAERLEAERLGDEGTLSAS